MAQIIPILLMVGAMWFFLVLPQQRRTKAHQAMVQSLDVGDHVLLQSGIYGVVTEFDGPAMFVAISDDVEIKVTKESVAEKVVYDDAPVDTVKKKKSAANHDDEADA